MDRAAIAQATLRVIEDGGYQAPDGRSVALRAAINAARAGTRLYRAEAVPLGEAAMRRQTRITVTEETTCEAIVRMAAEARGHLAALNFASARNPGGGFLGGAQAQEEALARSSALYPCLCTQQATYYEPNRANRSLLYLDLAIFSPGVPFFRDDAGNLLPQPALASVITAPAPNAGAVQNNQPRDVEKIEPTLRRRAEFVLAIAAQEKVERLILGAWGCGVFRNDPAMVARAFGDLLLRGGRYADVFSEVVFAIYDRTSSRGTLQAFKSEFRA
ncbi:MAG TPA: TIGR02452 family protein [Opitutaceae bacterium]